MSSEPRIAVIGLKGLPATGGGARAGSAVIQRLAEKYRFTVFAMASHASTTEPLPGVKQVVLPSPFKHSANLAAYYALSAIHALRMRKFDIIHFHHGMSGFVLPYLGRRIPTAVTLRGSGVGVAMDDRFSSFSVRLLQTGEQLALRYADEVVTVAKHHLPYYQSRRDGSVRWIPNGVDVQNIATISSNRDRANHITFSAARIIPLKGCHYFLQALKKTNLRTKVYVVGDLEEDSDYAREIYQTAQHLDVEFTGLISDPEELFDLVGRSRVFVFPSITEAMSNMLLEAVMTGVPIVCSDIPANREVLRDDEAIWFKSACVDDLAAKLRFAIGNEDKVERRALQARKRISREFSWDAIALDYDRLYQDLLNKR